MPPDDAYCYRMVISGAFAVMGLLLTALHLARPDLLRRVVAADTQLWWFLPWVSNDTLDPDGRYQRIHRRAVVAAVSMWTVTNLVLFSLPYAATVTPLLAWARA